MNKFIYGIMILFLSSTIAFADSTTKLVRSVICITNNTNKTYVFDVRISDPFWERRDVSLPLVGNEPGSNLDDKVIPPRKHICKKQEINSAALEKHSASAKLSSSSEKDTTYYSVFTVTVSGYEYALASGRLTLKDRAPDSIAINYFFVGPTIGNGPVHWTVASEKGPGPENKGQTDEGFFYSTEFINKFGESRETEACPAPYKHDKDCQSFEILN